MYKLFLYSLFFLLPLVHTKFFDTVFVSTPLFVDGNYEFTKVVFFNVLMGIILLSFLGEKCVRQQKILLPRKVFFMLSVILFTVITSTLFSLSPYTSAYWNGDKSHGLFVFINLIWLFVVLYNLPKNTIKHIVWFSLLSLWCVSILSIKELLFPTFDYWALSSRAFGTFGHPNYLALYIVTLFPFLVKWSMSFWTKWRIQYIYMSLLTMSCLTLILTKSILGIVLWWGYILYYLFCHSSVKLRTGFELNNVKPKYPWNVIQKSKRDSSTRSTRSEWHYLGYILLIIISWIITLHLLPPEKLHSFLSRFYLWETTLRIIISDWKIFIFGGGLETLDIYFNTFKSPYLYIYENYWFTADRPHNIFLNIWYHFGVIWLGILLYMLSFFWKHVQSVKVGKYESMIAIFFIFCFFNYPSIGVYILLILSLSLLVKKYASQNIHYFSAPVLLVVITCFSMYWAVQSKNLYLAELKAYDENYHTANDIFQRAEYYYKLWNSEQGKWYDPLPSEKYYTSHIQSFENITQNCILLVEKFPSVENYFYCGSILERIRQKELSQDFYRKGLKKLPDLWNEDSPYWDNYFIKHSITGNRFFSKKFSDVEEILEKVGK